MRVIRNFCLSAHIRALCTLYGIKFEPVVVEWRRSNALIRDRRIFVSPISGWITYYAALHEIGHVIGEYNRTRWLNKYNPDNWTFQPPIEIEYEAWIEAEKIALCWNQYARRLARVALSTHLRTRSREEHKSEHMALMGKAA